MKLEYEPDITEYLLRDSVKSDLDLNIEIDQSDSYGMSPYTIIVCHNIPIKYIKSI